MIESRDEYEAENIFWVPKEARWSFIMDNAKNVKIGQYIDDAMILIEKENTTLKGVLDKRYARPEIDKLGNNCARHQFINLFAISHRGQAVPQSTPQALPGQ